MMEINWKAMKTKWYMTDAWRAAQEPDAISEAIKTGEQIITLLTQTAALVERAYKDVDLIIEDATIRCEAIVDRLTGETNRLAPVLARLRAARKAVSS
jgi:hypothetical protein